MFVWPCVHANKTFPSNLYYKPHPRRHKNVDHSDLVRASTVCAAPTTSSLSIEHLVSMDWAAWRHENRLSFRIWCDLKYILTTVWCEIDQWIPLTKGQWRGQCIDLLTSSGPFIFRYHFLIYWHSYLRLILKRSIRFHWICPRGYCIAPIAIWLRTTFNRKSEMNEHYYICWFYIAQSKFMWVFLLARGDLSIQLFVNCK